jgi:hypothetical protein
MANALMQKGDPKSNHPLQVLRGKREPGRDLLEKAAEIAGFSLSECLKLPGDAGLRAASGSGFTNIYEALTFVLKFGGDDDIDEIGKHLLRVKRDVAATESPPVLASKR